MDSHGRDSVPSKQPDDASLANGHLVDAERNARYIVELKKVRHKDRMKARPYKGHAKITEHARIRKCTLPEVRSGSFRCFKSEQTCEVISRTVKDSHSCGSDGVWACCGIDKVLHDGKLYDNALMLREQACLKITCT